MISKKRLQFLFLVVLSFLTYLFFQHVDFQGYEDETYLRIRENIRLGEFKASRCGYGQIILETPFVFLGEKINTLFDGQQDEYVKFFALSYNPFITALTVGVIFFLFLLFIKNTQAFYLALVYGLGTMAFPYAVIGMEPTSVLFLSLSTLFLFKFGKDQRKINILLSGLFFFSLFFGKSYYFFTAPAFALYLFLIFFSREKPWFKQFFQSGLLFISPLIVILPLYLLGNFVSYGGYFKSPYVFQNELFGGENFIFGLYGLLFSFGKSFFIYNPIIVLSAFLFIKFYRRFSKEALFVAVYSACLLLFVSRVHWWSDETWGPRYLISLSFMWMLPLIMIFKDSLWQRKSFRFLLIVLIFFSFSFQMLGVLARYGVFPRTMKDLYQQTGHNTLTSGEYQYVPTFAPYLINARLIKNIILDRKDPLNFHLVYSPPMEQNAEGKEIIHDIAYKPPKETSVLDFWWRHHKKDRLMYFSILGGFALLYFLLYHFGRKLFRS